MLWNFAIRLWEHFAAVDTRHGTIAMAVNLLPQAALAQEVDWLAVSFPPVYWIWKRSMTALLSVRGTISIYMPADDTKKAAGMLASAASLQENESVLSFPCVRTRPRRELIERPYYSNAASNQVDVDDKNKIFYFFHKNG